MQKIVFLLPMLGAVGCGQTFANLTVQSTSVDSVRNNSYEGVVYYPPLPHLLVTPGKDGALTAQVVMLPDMQNPRTITWNAGIGSVNPGFTLTDGWMLTAVASEVDSGAGAIISGVGGVLGAAIGVVGLAEGEASSAGPGLYPIIPRPCPNRNGTCWSIDTDNPVMQIGDRVVREPRRMGRMNNQEGTEASEGGGGQQTSSSLELEPAT